MVNDMLINSYELVEPVKAKFKIQARHVPEKTIVYEGIFTEIRSVIMPDGTAEFQLCSNKIEKIGVE